MIGLKSIHRLGGHANVPHPSCRLCNPPEPKVIKKQRRSRVCPICRYWLPTSGHSVNCPLRPADMYPDFRD